MKAKSHAKVIVEELGPVLLMTLNRPEVLNAVDGELSDQLGRALTRLEESSKLRAGVITGSGRAFCAGLDMKAVANGAAIEATRHPEWGFAGIAARQLSKPLIAAVNGDAVGGGFEIVLACDLAITVPSARFALPEVKHGLIAAGGGIFRVSQQLPGKIASELLLTGRIFQASEAARWGLVNGVVPEAVVEEALRMAGLIAANGPLAVQATKRIHQAAIEASAAEIRGRGSQDREASKVFASRDAREGITAFVRGSQATFTGT